MKKIAWTSMIAGLLAGMLPFVFLWKDFRYLLGGSILYMLCCGAVPGALAGIGSVQASKWMKQKITTQKAKWLSEILLGFFYGIIAGVLCALVAGFLGTFLAMIAGG